MTVICHNFKRMKYNCHLIGERPKTVHITVNKLGWPAKPYHMCCLLVLQGGDKASILMYQVLHLALILFLESYQHYAKVLEYFQFILGLREKFPFLESSWYFRIKIDCQQLNNCIASIHCIKLDGNDLWLLLKSCSEITIYFYCYFYYYILLLPQLLLPDTGRVQMCCKWLGLLHISTTAITTNLGVNNYDFMTY